MSTGQAMLPRQPQPLTGEALRSNLEAQRRILDAMKKLYLHCTVPVYKIGPEILEPGIKWMSDESKSNYENLAALLEFYREQEQGRKGR